MDNEIKCPECEGTGVSKKNSLEFLCSFCRGEGQIKIQPATPIEGKNVEENLDDFTIT